MQAQKDVLKAIKKLASEAMMKNMDEDEALVAELDMQRMPKEEAMEMMAEDMDDMEEEDDLQALSSVEELSEDDEEDDEKARIKKMLGL